MQPTTPNTNDHPAGVVAFDEALAAVRRRHRGASPAATVQTAAEDLYLLTALLEHDPNVDAPPEIVARLLEIVDVLRVAGGELNEANA